MVERYLAGNGPQTATGQGTREQHSNATDELRPEYHFDYSKARPNPYAARLKGRAVAVVLDPDVAQAFPTSESVNTVLRSALREGPC